MAALPKITAPLALALAFAFVCAAQANAAEKPTFNGEVAPIIFKNCAPCHRPGEAAPFSLLSYRDAAKRARLIAKVTESRLMPPWKAEPASYEYRDDRRLSDWEVATLREWALSGAPEGNPAQRPEPPKFDSGWRLGEPDLVVEMPAPFHIPAEGPDIYRNIPVPLGTTEDKWIAAMDMRPSTRGVVHHVLYFADPSGQIHLREQQGNEPGFTGMAVRGAPLPLGGWALGGQPHFFPEGLALKLPKGSDLVVQYHFHPTGKAEEEKSSIGFYFAKKPPERSLTRVLLPPAYSLFAGLDIPAGEKDFVIRDSYVLPVAVDAIGAGAHAHNLARRLTMTATFPDGSVKTLLRIEDWDFAWQDRYYFKEFVSLPKGTRLESEIHWDNSAGNPRNPSVPPARVAWGEESKDEMGAISLYVVAHEQADFAELEKGIAKDRRGKAIARMKEDPALAKKVMRLLAE